MIITALGYKLQNVKQYINEFQLTKKYNHFMVDIETTGTSPDLNHIVEICVVPFGIGNNFIEVSEPQYHLKFKLNHNQKQRKYDQQTMIWWEKQSKEIADHVFSNFFDESIDNSQVLLQLAIFVGALTKGDTMFWSKPNSFDFMFMQSIFKDYQVIFPFKYWMAKDLAGFCCGISFVNQKTLDYRIYGPMKRIGAHDSMNDCYFQLS